MSVALAGRNSRPQLSPGQVRFESNTFCNLNQVHFAISLNQIHLAIWIKYILQFEWNTLYNLNQIHLAIWDKYILQFETNRFVNLRPIHFAIWDQYIFQFETNTFFNLRQVHFAIWNFWPQLSPSQVQTKTKPNQTELNKSKSN